MDHLCPRVAFPLAPCLHCLSNSSPIANVHSKKTAPPRPTTRKNSMHHKRLSIGLATKPVPPPLNTNGHNHTHSAHRAYRHRRGSSQILTASMPNPRPVAAAPTRPSPFPDDRPRFIDPFAAVKTEARCSAVAFQPPHTHHHHLFEQPRKDSATIPVQLKKQGAAIPTRLAHEL